MFQHRSDTQKNTCSFSYFGISEDLLDSIQQLSNWVTRTGSNQVRSKFMAYLDVCSLIRKTNRKIHFISSWFTMAIPYIVVINSPHFENFCCTWNSFFRRLADDQLIGSVLLSRAPASRRRLQTASKSRIQKQDLFLTYLVQSTVNNKKTRVWVVFCHFRNKFLFNTTHMTVTWQWARNYANSSLWSAKV